MKKIYESPESIAVHIEPHGRMLDDIVISNIGGGGEGLSREYNSVWDDDKDKGGKNIFDEEW